MLGNLRNETNLQKKLRPDLDQIFLFNSPHSIYRPVPVSVKNVNIPVISSTKRVFPLELTPKEDYRRVYNLSPYIGKKLLSLDRNLLKVGELKK